MAGMNINISDMSIDMSDINVFSILFSLNSPLNLKSPENFLASYKEMLGNKKPTRNNALAKTAKRYLDKYHEAEQVLLDLASSSISIFGWFNHQRKIRKARLALSEIKKNLMNWVSSTLVFFGL